MRVRAQAQLQLSQMHCYTRSTQIKNRCTAGGIARGVFRDFKLARVRLSYSAELFGVRLYITISGEFRNDGLTVNFFLLQYQFRQQALAGELAGVKKASW